MKKIKFTMQDTEEVVLPDVITTDDITYAAKVILFNDDWHTFEEVIEQIMKAIKCQLSIAEQMTWEVHNNGKTCVYSGDMPECLKVSSILEEIALNTEIEY